VYSPYPNIIAWGNREETSSAYYQDKPKSEKIGQSSPKQFVLGLQRNGTVVGDILGDDSSFILSILFPVSHAFLLLLSLFGKIQF